jgi:putative intracellular protease/amidase/YHS domain-containing protein
MRVMNRRELLQASAAAGLTAAVLPQARGQQAGTQDAEPSPLTPPASGAIPVAFVISRGAVLIDFVGPWEVFAGVSVSGRSQAFQPYTVAASAQAVSAAGGLRIVPDHTFASAPAPRLIVIPAQRDAGDAALKWIRETSARADLTMSVCTGAFVLARTGLLNGKAATTHHSAYSSLAMEFPQIQVKRGARFVEAGNVATAGGLTSGIDLALRVVQRYFGREVATQTADYLEYQGTGWLNPDANAAYRVRRVSTPEHPLCPVCDMDVDPRSAPHSRFRGETYYFCMSEHKALFDAAPEKFLAPPAGA